MKNKLAFNPGQVLSGTASRAGKALQSTIPGSVGQGLPTMAGRVPKPPAIRLPQAPAPVQAPNLEDVWGKSAAYTCGNHDAMLKLGFLGAAAKSIGSWAAKNPTLATSIGTGAVGSGIGAVSAGEGNRLQGALMGGVTGAGLGALGAKGLQSLNRLPNQGIIRRGTGPSQAPRMKIKGVQGPAERAAAKATPTVPSKLDMATEAASNLPNLSTQRDPNWERPITSMSPQQREGLRNATQLNLGLEPVQGALQF